MMNSEDKRLEVAAEYIRLYLINPNEADSYLDGTEFSIENVRDIVEPALQIQMAGNVATTRDDAPNVNHLLSDGDLFGNEIKTGGRRYKIRENLGSGGFGTVYRAADLSKPKNEGFEEVAIKIQSSQLLTQKNEIHALTRLRHRQIARVLDFDFELGYFTMPYVAGSCSIRRFVDDQKPVTLERQVQIFVSLAKALAYAHGEKLLHRDISPGNVILTPNLCPILIDFGLVKIFGEKSSNLFPDGTLFYTAPEVAQNGIHSERSDLYSLGAVLYYFVTGTNPNFMKRNWKRSKLKGFDPKKHYNNAALQHRRLAFDKDAFLKPVRDINPNIDETLEQIIQRVTHRNPDQRYKDANHFAEELQKYLNGEETEAKPLTAIQRTLNWCKYHKKGISIATTIGGVLVAFLATHTWRYIDHQDQMLNAAEANFQIVANKNQQLKIAISDRKTELHARKTSDQKRIHAKTTELVSVGKFDDARAELLALPKDRMGFESYYQLRGLPYSSQTVVGQHDFGITASVFDQKTQVAVTAGLDGRLCVWDAPTGTELHTLEKGRWLTDQRRPAFALFDNTGSTTLYNDLAWVEEGQAFLGGTKNGDVTQWDIKTQTVKILFSFGESVTSICYDPASKRCFCGLGNQTFAILDLATQELSMEPIACNGTITDIAFHPSIGWILATDKGTLELRSTTELTTFDKVDLPGMIWDIEVDKAGEKVYVAAGSSSVRSWAFDAKRRKLIASDQYKTRSMGEAVHAITLDDKGKHLIAGTDAPALVCWNLLQPNTPLIHSKDQQGSLSLTLGDRLPIQYQRRYTDLHATSEENVYYSAGINATLRKVQFTFPERESILPLTPNSKVCFDGSSPDILWEGTVDGTLRAWNVNKMAVQAKLDKCMARIKAVCPVPSGSMISGDKNGEIVVWNLDGNKIHKAKTVKHDKDILTLAVSPDSERFAVCDGTSVTLYSIGTGRKLGVYPNAQLNSESKLCFGKSGKQLAVYIQSASCVLLDGKDAKFIKETDLFLDVTGTSCLIADCIREKSFLAGVNKGDINLYPFRPLPDSSQPKISKPVAGMVFVSGSSTPFCSPRLIVANEEGKVRIIDIEDSGQLLELTSPVAGTLNPLIGLESSCDGSRFAIVHQNGMVAVLTAWQKERQFISPDVDRHVLKKTDNENRLMFSGNAVVQSGETTVFQLGQQVSPSKVSVSVCSWDGKTLAERFKNQPVKDDGQLQLPFSFSLVEEFGKIRSSYVDVESHETCINVFQLSGGSAGSVSRSRIPSSLYGGKTHSCSSQDGNSTTVHFSTTGYFLKQFLSHSTGHDFRTVGRQGDGIGAKITPSTDSHFDILFTQMRCIPDSQLAVFGRIAPNGDLLNRMVVSRDPRARVVGIRRVQESQKTDCYVVSPNPSHGMELTRFSKFDTKHDPITSRFWKFAAYQRPVSIKISFLRDGTPFLCYVDDNRFLVVVDPIDNPKCFHLENVNWNGHSDYAVLESSEKIKILLNDSESLRVVSFDPSSG